MHSSSPSWGTENAPHVPRAWSAGREGEKGPPSGTLYLVATPIGHLGDLGRRAEDVLGSVDLIAAEDTRRTRKLLAARGIRARLISYHEHNERRRAAELIAKLQAGLAVALVCDAGTPGISDPGQHVVGLALKHGIPVVAVPGPSAITAALSIAGLPADRFVFEGFLPAKGKRRREALERLVAEERTTVLFEAPHRVLRTLGDLAACLKNRILAVCHEISKVHEEVIRGTVDEVAACMEAKWKGASPCGEFVLVVAGRSHAAKGPGDVEGIKLARGRDWKE